MSDIHDDLLARHRRVLPRWLALNYEHPIALVDGDGRRVRDAEGREYLDFLGGILTTMTGYRVPRVVEAIRRQAERMLHTSTLYLIPQQIELAEKIASLVPIPDARVFFTTSGTEANDTALLLATTFRRSNQVLAMRNSFHGRSFSAMSVTGNRFWSATSLAPFHVTYLHGAYQLRSPFRGLSPADYIAACVSDLESVLDTAVAGDAACLIAEPIQGVGGNTHPPDGMYGALKEGLDRRGILFISDEVQTGWGRTGEHFWGFEAHGVVPDIITFAKGLGNGVSLGGVIARAGDHGLPGGQLDLHLRRQPTGDRGGPGQPGVPARGGRRPVGSGPMHETRLQVRWSELDPYGHVNHAVYLTYLEHARIAALESIGWGLAAIERLASGSWWCGPISASAPLPSTGTNWRSSRGSPSCGPPAASGARRSAAAARSSWKPRSPAPARTSRAAPAGCPPPSKRPCAG